MGWERRDAGWSLISGRRVFRGRGQLMNRKPDDRPENDNKDERLKKLGEYIRGASLETMNFIHGKLTNDKGSADPYVGAQVAGLAAIYLINMATKEQGERMKLIDDMKKAVQEIDGDADVLAMDQDAQFICLPQSSIVH